MFSDILKECSSLIFKGQKFHEECPMALEDEGTTLLENGGKHSPSDTVPCLRKPQCSDTVLHKSQISQEELTLKASDDSILQWTCPVFLILSF